MATYLVKATGGDFSTLTAALAGTVSGDIIEVAAEAFSEGPLTVSGQSNRTIRAAGGAGHGGVAGVGARYICNATPSASNGCIRINEPGFTLEGLEITRSYTPVNNRTHYGIHVTSTGARLRRNLIHGFASAGSGAMRGIIGDSGQGCGDLNLIRNIIYNITAAGGNARGTFLNVADGDTMLVIGNTIYNCSQYCCQAFNTSSTGVIEFKGNIGAAGGTAAFDVTGTGTINASHNCSDDASAPGTSPVSATAANLFVSVTGGSEDLHLKSGANAIDAGADFSGLTSTWLIDIDSANFATGFAGSGWDIGADEFGSPPAPPAFFGPELMQRRGRDMIYLRF